MLTNREKELLTIFYCQSLNYGELDRKKAAKIMQVSDRTLRQYLSAINKKLKCHDLTSAILRAKDVLRVIG